VPSPRLILVRHGRSAHVHTGWIDAAGVRHWQRAYDAVGIRADDAPPPALVALAREAALVVTSDLPRAIETAARLRPDGDVPRSPLLREVPVLVPSLGGARLPLGGWALAAGVHWLHRRARRVPRPPEVSAQAGEAAAWLHDLAHAHGTVLAVTHAGVRRAIADALVERRWVRDPGPRGMRAMHHWSAWSFAAPAAR
jgi:broad specificity phosphatase PhoE